MKRIADEEIPAAVIMEDNVAFRGHISEHLRRYEQELLGLAENDWDLLFDSNLRGFAPEGPLLHGSVAKLLNVTSTC